MNRQMTIYDSIALTQFDNVRMKSEANKLFNHMMDGKWRTKEELCEELGLPAITISSHLRLFKQRLKDSHTLTKRLRDQDKDIYEYQLIDFSEPLNLAT